MIVTKVPKFPSFFNKYFALNFSQCIKPTHFEHVLHVQTESFFDKIQTIK